jgi:DNA uptake protein ComE-like DNA-binding protein
LSVAVLVFLLFNTYYNQYRLSAGFEESVDPRKQLILDSLLALLPPEKNSYQDFPENQSVQTSSFASFAKEPELALHSFDPNVVAKEEWLDMGLPEKVFNGLEKYRSKGGKIRSPEQVLKLYHLKPETGEKMIPFIRIDSSRLFARSSFPAKFTPKVYQPKPVDPPFDLNEADTNQLKKVFGIGSKTALRILKYRNGLGGFVKKEQVYEVFALDSQVVEELFKKSFLPPNPKVTTLKINQLTEEELAQNPYIRKGLARIIVKYRNQHGPFTRTEDLLKIKILNPEVVSKIQPYLEF